MVNGEAFMIGRNCQELFTLLPFLAGWLLLLPTLLHGTVATQMLQQNPARQWPRVDGK